MSIKKISISILLIFISITSFEQNVSSPYSILGVGDIETSDYGRYVASGGAAVARREENSYNYSNPASLTAMIYKSVNFDFALRGRYSKFKQPGTDTFTSVSKDFIVKRATFAFKVTPTVGFALGIKPFSSVNYQYQNSVSIASGGTDYYTKSVDGSGGLYQPYLAFAKEFNRHFSVGAEASCVFGSLLKTTEYSSQTLNLDIIKSENKFYSGGGFKIGLQYYSLSKKEWQHVIGFTYAFYTQLKGQLTTDYTTQLDTSIKSLPYTPISFRLPSSFKLGYTLINNNSGLLFTTQLGYDMWSQQQLDYVGSYTQNSLLFNAGAEYRKKVKQGNHMVEKYYFGIGTKAEKSYLVVNGQPIYDYAFSVGGGENILRYLAFNAALEFGKKGSVISNQIQESYTQLSLSLTVKDFWFGTKKFGRYN